MAGGSSLSPLTGPADSVRRALGAAILNADSLKETPAAGLTRAGVPVRGTPSPAGTTRFAGDDIAEAFQRADLASLKGFIDSMQSGPFALSLPGAELAAGAAKSAPKPQGAPGGMA